MVGGEHATVKLEYDRCRWYDGDQRYPVTTSGEVGQVYGNKVTMSTGAKTLTANASGPIAFSTHSLAWLGRRCRRSPMAP